MIWLVRLQTLRSLVGSLQLGWRLFWDPRTPNVPKLLLGIALLLIVSPINWIPSSIPVLGQLEDIALLAFAVNRFIRAVPADLRAEHEARCRTSAVQLTAY
jgi:uncharacterized membrane protein YkvA (DUF1232 family)